MKGFALNEQGDLLIENGVIQMVHGAELTMQTIKSVLGTQKGEWFLNWEEGINHREILGKKRYDLQNPESAEKNVAAIKELRNRQQQVEAKEIALTDRLARRLDGEI